MISRSLWFTQDVPFAGEAGDRLAQQARMHVPGKVIPGSRLRLELCGRQGQALSPAKIDAIVLEWMSPITPDGHSVCREVRPVTVAFDTLGQVLTQAEMDWAKIEDRIEWCLRLDGHMHRCVGTIRQSWVRFQGDITLLTDPGIHVHNAVLHNLLEMNTRLCGCRASLADRRVTVEVVIPVEDLATQFTHAMGALRRGTAELTTTIGWLQQTGVAERYNRFHQVKKGGEDHESQCCSRRLESLAGSR